MASHLFSDAVGRRTWPDLNLDYATAGGRRSESGRSRESTIASDASKDALIPGGLPSEEPSPKAR